MGSFLSDIASTNHDIGRQLPLNAETPALFLRSAIVGSNAERTVCSKTDVVQQAERTSCGLNQSIGERVVQVQVRRLAIAVIGCDNVGVFIETGAAIGHNSAG